MIHEPYFTPSVEYWNSLEKPENVSVAAEEIGRASCRERV